MKLSLKAARAASWMIVGVVSAGCFSFTRYETVSEMPEVYRARVANVDAYYLEKARKQAAFVSKCPLENVTAQIITTRPESLAFDGNDGKPIFVSHADVLESIGTEGCESRQVFKVICGPYQRIERPESSPCDVAAAADAASVHARNGDEQRRINEQNAAFMMQRQQQEQSQK